jgi:flagellar FliL protein
MSKAPEKEETDENLPAIDDGSGEGAAAGGGSKKKKLIMILVPLVLLIGGGAGLYFTGMLDKLLGKETVAEAGAEGDKAGEHGEAKAEGEAKGEGGHGEGGEGGEHAGPSFLKVPDLIVNLNGEGQPRYLRLSVQLELANELDMKAVEAVLPRVIDQFQTYLRELRVQDLRGSKGMYRLQMELLSRVNAAAAPTEVKDVLFQEILIQ